MALQSPEWPENFSGLASWTGIIDTEGTAAGRLTAVSIRAGDADERVVVYLLPPEVLLSLRHSNQMFL